MENDIDRPDPSFTALYHGVVTANADPLKIGRVRVRVMGLVEPESDWAFPIATVGGGESALGFYSVPKVGAEVGVWFKAGDVDHPFYVAGHWGAPGGSSQAPTPVRDATPEEAPLIRCFETERHIMTFDARPGRESMEFKDKVSGDGIAFDGLTRSLEISGTVAVIIKSTGAIKIDGTAVTINNRIVLPSGDPI